MYYLSNRGKFVDKKLEQLGGVRIHEMGSGDDDANLEDDFITWKEAFWTSVCKELEIEDIGDDFNTRQYEHKVRIKTLLNYKKKIFFSQRWGMFVLLDYRNLLVKSQKVLIFFTISRSWKKVITTRRKYTQEKLRDWNPTSHRDHHLMLRTLTCHPLRSIEIFIRFVFICPFIEIDHRLKC